MSSYLYPNFIWSMIDDDAEVDDDYLEEGEERCPICGLTNHPGAGDTCGHFVGALWDGEIIWSCVFPRFDAAWSAVSSFLYESGQEQMPKLRGQAARAGFDPRLVEVADPYEFGASYALQELVEFSAGPTVTTEGMLSGSGCSLYHADPTAVHRLAIEYERLLPVLEVVSAPLSSQDPS